MPVCKEFFLYIIVCLIDGILSQNTCGGTGNGGSCVFPFIYKGLTWNSCTTYGRQRPWCSTTNNWDNDKLWGYCDCNNITPTPTTIWDDNIPVHYYYTNNGALSVLVIKLGFQSRINIDGNVGFTFNDLTNNIEGDGVTQYYKDSSWNKMTYEFTFLSNQYKTLNNPSTITTDQISIESFRFAEIDGFIWCNGVCGYPNGNTLREGSNHFDQILTAVHTQSDNSQFNGWAGLGVVGHPKSWIKNNSFTAAIIQHEFGHNLGLNHQYNNKYERSMNGFSIGGTTDNESRMGNGGSVKGFDTKSRYVRNGHFGPCG